ncbi:MAG: hypothetical protein E7355_00695 [Clostridiales bacterium]|nr:hypothetical protein [Clostridiales bacterium]
MDEQENKSQVTADEDCQKAQPQTEENANREEQPLDTETTFADMNVEGFSWYNPRKKKGKGERIKLSRKEYWAMVRGAFAAYLPMFLCIISAFAIVVLLAYIWLKP